MAAFYDLKVSWWKQAWCHGGSRRGVMVEAGVMSWWNLKYVESKYPKRSVQIPNVQEGGSCRFPNDRNNHHGCFLR
jgi:hypothetical protein